MGTPNEIKEEGPIPSQQANTQRKSNTEDPAHYESMLLFSETFSNRQVSLKYFIILGILGEGAFGKVCFGEKSH